ncbi:Ca2+-binding RTX toxin-like protein [Sphingomonas naasensis]|uniref:Matrixin family metalloprotease n=1 Tax=Sphingomonas naasensis TaxID=1344951 RepID=A0A4V3QWZ3_9SPHN|nr:M10 family metallopeptidase C-terminal domain-containing protein [Sphingomonas naasensis]NIJ20310.1 Ca2+-binding RTX toxin-like protein [Sphingomonas naasensis]TGX44432.1 matrixin family metalloprotease [Sphingomonas naasensis]
MSTSEFGNSTPTDGQPLSWDSLSEVVHNRYVEGCGCAGCQGSHKTGTHEDDTGASGGGSATGANPEGGSLGVLLPLVTNPDGSKSITGNRNVDAVLIGSKWGTQNLTYSFPTAGSNYNGIGYDTNGVSSYQLELGSMQQAAARAAFAQISAATGLTFTEITETDTVHANIRISQTGDSDVASAYGGFPSDTRGVAGDIWFGRNNQPYYDMATQGTWGFATIMHEIGHTMGLKHGHQDYTNSDLSFYFGSFPRFGTQSLTPDRDGQSWSLMTYTPAPFTNSNFAGEKVNQPQTYMQYDLAALQYMYGANYTTNATDTVYSWSATTGEMFINGVGQGAPSGNKIYLTIWDGGGNDTIDVSNYSGGVTVDLRPGEFSTFDQAQLANNLAYQNLVNLAPGNIAMSLLYNNDSRSLIENAKGGVGNDIFVGNTANNILDGGAGSDTVIFTNTTGISVTLNDTNADVIVTHDGETDTLRSIENIGGTSGNDTLTGNSQANILVGGSGGADVLTGLGGDDRLIGGGFTTTTTYSAPSQADITKAQSTSNGSIATAVDTTGAFDVDANPDITNAGTLPHATINATAAGGAVEYYKIVVTQAGAQAIFDIDGNGTLTDSILELVNSSGVVLASNDTGSGDASPAGHDDAYLVYTFAAPGTYYIRVGQWTGSTIAQPLDAGMTYQLNISLQGAAAVTTTVTANNTSSAVLDGGEGNDFLQGTIANDVLIGGNGIDTASFVNAFSGGSTTGVTVDLNLQGAAQNTVAAGSDTLTGIENLVGSALNDTLIGDGNNNVIEGGLGNDVLTGGGGIDTASFAGTSSGVTVNLAGQGAAQNTGAGSDTLSGFENLEGSAFADSLTGDSNANTLTGGAGDDTLNPGANTVGAIDLLDGGLGSDTASFADATSAVTAVLTGGTDGIALFNGMMVATLRSIENLRGGSAADFLVGDANGNVIDGGLGDDILNGGDGVDTISFASNGATGITVNLGTLSAQNTGAGNKTIMGFENVRTTAGADNVTGDGGDNVFYEAGGADTYNGAGGSDTLDYSAATSTVTINLNTATAQNTGASTGSDTITNMENVIGSASFANALNGGNTTANRLVGGAAADFLVGNGQGDTLIGGAGNDVIFGDYVNSLSTGGATADGVDVLEGGAGSDQLVGGLGNDILRGGDGDDTLVGGIANGSGSGLTQVYTNDGGQDTFDGGEGSDIAYAYYTDQTGGIAFDLANVAGNSAITMGGVAAGAFISIERVIFRGGLGNDVVRGSGALDTLVGNAGDDVLDGWFGNDTLSGGLGNDTLIGGEGLDTATYVNATAGVNVDLRIAGAQDTGGEGTDTLVDIEYLTGSNFGDTLRGNDAFNLLVDNAVSGAAGQTDSLFGYGGNDSILVTRATGTVATNVNMDGGDGDDLIELRSGALSTLLAANAAGLIGNTYAALGTTGNRYLDTVVVDGGAGSDRIILTAVKSAVIDAGSGNDTLSLSLLGAATESKHTVTLGTGQDTIQLAGTGAVASTTDHGNVVTDFEVGDAGDRFELTTFLNGSLLGYTANANAFASGHLRLVQSGTDVLLQVDRDAGGAVNGFVTLFTIANSYTGGFTAYNFDGFIGDLVLTGFDIDETITGATGNDTLSGAGGNDVLIGLAGNDTLDGGTGDDTLFGGQGDDILKGGAGIDTASYSDAAVGVTVNLSLTGPQATGAGSDTLSEIENLTGSAFNDVLTGDTGANLLVGGAGDDRLDGGAGADGLTGGIGNDTYVVDDAGDVVTELAGEGTDTVESSISYTLGAELENLVLTGSAANGTGNDLANSITGNELDNILRGYAGNDSLVGNGGNDTLLGGTGSDSLDGGAGNDRLDGGVDGVADTLKGGIGNDTYVVGEAGELITELAGEGGADRVVASINYTLGANLEELELVGNAKNGTGNALDNLIIANNQKNVLDGGAGIDTVSYEASDAGVLIRLDNVRTGNLGFLGNILGALEDLLPDGVGGYAAGDRLLNFENVTGSAHDDTLFGNNIANVLHGGAGNDTLYGDDGNDSLYGDGGRDTLIGGSGADLLFGGGDIDSLTGGDGNDRLNGGAGLDILTGGAGNDVFVFTDLGWDSVTDFRRGQDKIDLSGLDADTRTAAVDAFHWIGNAGFSGNAGELQLSRILGEYYLAGDTNGDGIADLIIGLGNVQLQSSDILFG